jgi:hypothetical protein
MALTWVSPTEGQCVGKTAGLLVAASSTKPVRSVRFLVDGKQVGIDRKGASDLFASSWPTRRASAGKHELRAVATDARGRTLAATRHVKVCR